MAFSCQSKVLLQAVGLGVFVISWVLVVRDVRAVVIFVAPSLRDLRGSWSVERRDTTTQRLDVLPDLLVLRTRLFVRLAHASTCAAKASFSSTKSI